MKPTFLTIHALNDTWVYDWGCLISTVQQFVSVENQHPFENIEQFFGFLQNQVITNCNWIDFMRRVEDSETILGKHSYSIVCKKT